MPDFLGELEASLRVRAKGPLSKHSRRPANKRTALLVAAVAVVGSVGGAAAAGVNVPIVHPGSGEPSFQQKVDATDVSITRAFGVLRTKAPIDADAAQSLRNGFGVAPGEYAIGKADFDAARLVSVSDLEVYVIPSGKKICVILAPDGPNAPRGGGCNTLEEAETGYAFAARISPQKSDVAILVADGNPPPVVVQADGSKSAMKVVDNVAAGTIEAGAHVITAEGNRPLL